MCRQRPFPVIDDRAPHELAGPKDIQSDATTLITEGQAILAGMLGLAAFTQAGYFAPAHQRLHIGRREIEKLAEERSVDQEAFVILLKDHLQLP
jgi:hypothetical protein